MRSRGSRGSGRKGSRGRSDTRRRGCEDGAESEGCGDGRGAASSRDGGRGAATPRRLQGAPRPRPTPARHTGCKLQDAEGRRSESWSRGTATAAERESRAGLPPPQQALGSSPAQPRVPRGHHTQYVGRRMAEREAECVNKVFQAQTGKSTFDELGHSETPLKLAPQLHLSIHVLGPPLSLAF